VTTVELVGTNAIRSAPGACFSAAAAARRLTCDQRLREAALEHLRYRCLDVVPVILPAAAGVHVQTHKRFNTYSSARSGWGIRRDRRCTARVEVLSDVLSAAPYIACGTSMTPQDYASNTNSVLAGGANSFAWTNALIRTFGISSMARMPVAITRWFQPCGQCRARPGFRVPLG